MKRCNSEVVCIHDRSLVFSKDGYPIMDCSKCHRRFAELIDVEHHLERVYSDDYFFNGKDGYPNYLHEKELLIRYGKYYAEIISRYAKPGKLLDVGSAAGFIMKGFESSGWNCTGIEPNSTMAAYGKNELNLDICKGDLETYESDTKFDLIILIQVIGHFYNIDRAMANISDLLKQHGLVLVESWNMKSFIARILGKNWHEYSPPSVINWFSNESLKTLFNNYGFELLGSGLPAKKIILKHALSLISKDTPNGIFKKQIINYLSRSIGNISISYPPIDLKWYVFKKL